MAERKVFLDSVIPLPDQGGITHHGMFIGTTTAEHKKELMTLLFSLALPGDQREELERRVALGEIVPPEELETYAPDAAEMRALESWLKKHRFEIVGKSGDRTSLYARASVNTIEKALAVKMVRVTKNGITYTAAQNAPSLPAAIAKSVHAIIGLQPYRQARKHIKCTPTNGNRAKLGAATGAKGSPILPNFPPYLVSEILEAYGASDLQLSGQGQTIAILIDTFPIDSDLQAFWRKNKVSTALNRIEKINVTGGQLPAPEGEETIDAEWSSGIAPGATIRIYATGSLAYVDLNRGLDRLIADLPSNPGMRQLSISIGMGETYMGGLAAEVTAQHQKFLRLAAAGVNVFVSSGDAGSNPDQSGHASDGPTQVEYESSDPNVIGVGGTTLALNASGGVADETGWSGAGGGKSILFQRPPWQKGSGVPTGAERLVPDVSLAADPNKGGFLVFHGIATQVGGTSWSTPMWAGFCALINEARSKVHQPPIGFLNPLIYPLSGTVAFRDIRKGSNGAYQAGPGYDMVTGIGVPNVKELIRALTS